MSSKVSYKDLIKGKSMKNLYKLSIVTVACVSFIGCGETEKKDDTKQEINRDKKVENLSTPTTPSISKSNSKPFIKKYDIKSGIVEYEVKGSGNIMGLTTKTVGTKRVIFLDYGSHEIIEKKSVEKKDINGKSQVVKTHTLVYNKDAVIYKTDFTNKVIKRMKNPAIAMMLGSNPIKMIENLGGKKIGTDKVLGYKCDIWSIMGSKQCIYKGVALRVETDIMGIKNVEVATKADFNVNIDKHDFKLPNFPIAGIHKDKIKLEEMDEKAKKDAIENKDEIAQIGHSIKEVQKQITANPNMSKEERKKVILESLLNSKNMKSKFQQQKESMPKILDMMKSYRACIVSTSSQSDMDSCEKDVSSLSKKLGLDDFDVDKEDKLNWSKENKKQTLKEIDEGIKEVSKNIPCMKKSHNMMEFIQCARNLK